MKDGMPAACSVASPDNPGWVFGSVPGTVPGISAFGLFAHGYPTAASPHGEICLFFLSYLIVGMKDKIPFFPCKEAWSGHLFILRLKQN